MPVKPETAPTDLPNTEVRLDDEVADIPLPTRDYFPPPRELRGNLSGWTYPAVFLVAILATVLIVQAVLSMDSGEPLRPICYVAAAIWLASIPPMLSAVSRGRTRMRIETSARVRSERGALVVQRALDYEIALVVFCVSLGTAAGVFALGEFTHTLTLAMHPPIPWWMAAAVAVVSFGYIIRYATHPALRQLILTPGYIVLPTLTTSVGLLGWAAMDEIAVLSRNNSKGTIRITSPSAKPQRPKVVRVHAEKLSIGSTATYWLLRFYQEHPALRPELADTRALERLRAYDLITEP